jgi:cyclic pyranopterin phosphate synthase
MNMVVMKGINENEITEMIKKAGKLGAILQLIELEVERKTISKGFYGKYHTDMQKIETELAGEANRIEKRELHHRIKYFVPNEVEVVRPMHNTEFCANCNRIRLTSDGKLKPCLFDNKNLIDILTPMRAGSADETIKFLFLQAIELRRPYWQ